MTTSLRSRKRKGTIVRLPSSDKKLKALLTELGRRYLDGYTKSKGRS